MTFRHRDVFLASFVAFIAWGFLTSWLPFLRYLWYAFIAGIITTLGIVIIGIISTSRKPPRRSATVQSGTSVRFLATSIWPSETSRFASSRSYKSTQLYPPSFVISQALDGLLGLALRDFVSSWYGNITKSPVFANEVDGNIRAALINIRDRLLKEDLINIVVSRFVPILTTHLHEFDQAERSVRGGRLNRNVTDSDELDLAIAAKYRDGKLHQAAALTYSDTKLVQQEHLRKIMIRLLPEFLPESVIGSRAVSVLLKEIVSCAVLSPVMQMLSDPDTWNQLIEAYGRTTLQDRKTVRRMRAALDEHTSPMPKRKEPQDFPRLAVGDNERVFERFVRAIRKTNNLSDARRFRSQVASQLKRESMVEGQDQTYLRRLETAKRVLDQKVAKLVTVGSAIPAAITQPDFRNGSGTPSRELSLVEIMHTSSGLSYFMEYMDRQRLMSQVQFWVVVDGFRNPLEDDFGDDSTSSHMAWTDADRMDIAQISETYMSKPELKVSEDSKKNIKRFLQAGRAASVGQYQAARTAILSAQSAILEEMQGKHVPGFRKSDLYYKFLASDDYHNTGAAMTIQETDRPPSPIKPVRPQALPMIRTTSQPSNKAKDLRRAVASSSDIRSLSSASLFESLEPSRRSFDTEGSIPLFDDDYDTDPLAHSTQSIGRESLNGDAGDRKEVLENMEAAMNDIMTDNPHEDILDDTRDALFGSPVSSRKSVKSMDSPKNSLDFGQSDIVAIGERSKPSLATLGLVSTSSRIGVFSDNDLFPDEKKFIEDEYTDQDPIDDKEEPEEDIHEAAPGDLGLAEAITALSNDIEKLVSQESVVDALTRKAELTNNVAELRILGKSKASLQREIRRKELQRQQYIVQESDNSLYGRSSIRISSVMVGKEDDGREYALYVLEVQRQAGDQMPAAGWAIARRYSEFHDLHQRLRRRYPSTRSLEFPRRRMVMKLQRTFLQGRRSALEAYMQQLLRMPDVCRSRELRSFLSQQAILPNSSNPNTTTDAQDIVSRIYSSVTDGMDDFLGNIAVLDQLSAAGQNLISAATSQIAATQPDSIMSVEPGSIAEAEAEVRAFEDRELEPFVKPICDIFLEMFELNRGNNWLRGRAVVVVLHQLLGGTVERKIRDIVKTFVAEDAFLKYIDLAKETMWPNGQMRVTKPRTKAEKEKSRKEATAMLGTLIPDMAGSVVGRANAQNAARRIAGCMNNERLNNHLAFTMLDEILGVLFGKGGKIT